MTTHQMTHFRDAKVQQFGDRWNWRSQKTVWLQHELQHLEEKKKPNTTSMTTWPKDPERLPHKTHAYWHMKWNYFVLFRRPPLDNPKFRSFSPLLFFLPSLGCPLRPSRRPPPLPPGRPSPPGGPSPKGLGARRVGGPKGGGPKISRSFFLLPGDLVEFWWCFGRSGPQMCLFSPSVCPVKPGGPSFSGTDNRFFSVGRRWRVVNWQGTKRVHAQAVE